jgi:predicted  nucleic acid-binding Zn-ribbon protein
MEKRFEAMKRERDALARAQDDSALRRELAKAADALAAKQREVDAVRGEGESLSKRQLAMETVLKRLRAEKKDDEQTIATLTARATAAETQLSAARDRVRELEALERRSAETLDGLREVGAVAAKQQEKWEKQLSELTAAKADLQQALERSWKELGEVRRGAVVQAERQEAAVQDAIARVVAEHKREDAEAKAAHEERE